MPWTSYVPAAGARPGQDLPDAGGGRVLHQSGRGTVATGRIERGIVHSRATEVELVGIRDTTKNDRLHGC